MIYTIYGNLITRVAYYVTNHGKTCTSINWFYIGRNLHFTA